jgi:hypothetical protein
MRRVLLAGALWTALLAVASGPAAADCIGPTIEIAQRELAPGGAIKVLGSGWGDECYDTGPPPDGEGVLGVAVKGIEIFVVQGDREWLIAAGTADARYGFTATATVPSDVTRGAARVQARSRLGVAYSSNPNFVVIDAAVPAAVGTKVVPLGPSAAALESVTPQTTPDPTTIAEMSTSSTGVVTSQSTAGALDPCARSSTTTGLIVGGIALTLVALAGAVFLARSGRD